MGHPKRNVHDAPADIPRGSFVLCWFPGLGRWDPCPTCMLLGLTGVTMPRTVGHETTGFSCLRLDLHRRRYLLTCLPDMCLLQRLWHSPAQKLTQKKLRVAFDGVLFLQLSRQSQQFYNGKLHCNFGMFSLALCMSYNHSIVFNLFFPLRLIILEKKWA